MTRTIIREHIFKLLFRVEFHNTHELDEQIRLYIDGLGEMKQEDCDYITEKTQNIAALIPEIDDKINSVSEGWPVSRLGKTELAIMRLAVYEMLYDEDIPVNVAINEAVELAKNYGGDNAPSFINGVLAKLANRQVERIMPGVYTVTQMNSYIKNMFRQDFVLSRISVKGEISNCKYHTSGHIYFTLKDACGVMSAIMFAGSAKALDFHLENGMQVIVSGRIDVYERDGKYQLYASTIEADGQGDLYKRFEELKHAYEEMGYFSREYKRPVPAFAQKVGIVTASTGAAVHDIMNISYRRNPYVALYLYPALVQGEMAAESIAKGIAALDEMGLDVIIAGRGGGSMEDLWAFNEEPVIEAIFAAKTPVISAVGHETDFTIADFVADLRAPTPSAAAELAVCDISLVEERIAGYAQQLGFMLQRKVSDYRSLLDKYAMQLAFFNPVSRIQDKRQQMMQMEERMEQAMQKLLGAKRHQMELYAARLNGFSPLGKLSQGYAYIEHEDGSRICGVTDIKEQDNMKIYMKDGIVKVQALEVIHGKGTDA